MLAGGVRLDDHGAFLDRRRARVPDEVAEGDDDRQEAAGHSGQRPYAARTHPGKYSHELRIRGHSAVPIGYVPGGPTGFDTGNGSVLYAF